MSSIRSRIRRFATELQKAASGNPATNGAVTRALAARGLLSAKEAEPDFRPEAQASVGFAPEPLTTRVLDAIRDQSNR